MRDKLGISDQYNALDALPTNKWQLCGLEKNSRVMSILNLVVCQKLQGMKRTSANVRKVVQHLIVDVSQNPCRNSCTNKKGVNHTLCSSTVQVHVGLQRPITPRELLFQQGHPSTIEIPEDVSMSSVQKLAGQGMALPSLATCLWCQYLLLSSQETR